MARAGAADPTLGHRAYGLFTPALAFADPLALAVVRREGGCHVRARLLPDGAHPDPGMAGVAAAVLHSRDARGAAAVGGVHVCRLSGFRQSGDILRIGYRGPA